MRRKPVDLFLREVMRWEPDGGFQRVEQHLRRLLRSADALGFRAPNEPLKTLNAHVGGETPLIVRIEMNHRGELTINTEAYEPIEVKAPWRVKIASSSKLDTADTFYRHKSTRREPYEAARKEYSAKDVDEVLLLNERGEICEGTTTSIFVPLSDGTFATPPLDSGILPGVLRADMIRARKATGKVIRPTDLDGKTFQLGNSLYGLIPAILV